MPDGACRAATEPPVCGSAVCKRRCGENEVGNRCGRRLRGKRGRRPAAGRSAMGGTKLGQLPVLALVEVEGRSVSAGKTRPRSAAKSFDSGQRQKASMRLG